MESVTSRPARPLRHGAARRAWPLLGLAVLVACGPTQAAAPPEVDLVRPTTTTLATIATTPPNPPTSTTDPAPSPTSVLATATTETTTTSSSTSTTPSTTTTTTTTTAPPPPPTFGESTDGWSTGWALFDEQLRRALIGPGTHAASVAVSIDGELVHQAAFGERMPGSGDPTEPQDRFRIASISKVVTTIVVHRLAADGRLDLDAPVGRRLADAIGVGVVDRSIEALTARQLLGHVSGFPVDRTIWFGNGASDCADAARRILPRGPVTPGGFQYSNTNYCLLGLLIAEVTGQSYEDTTYQLLLGPLGITGMRLAGTYDVGPDEVLHVSAPGRNYMEVLGAAGSWIASASDVVRILDTLRFIPAATGPDLADGSSGAYRPLDDGALFTMRLPSSPGGWYGSGLMLFEDGSVGHTGTVEETHTMAVTRPDGVTWAVLVSGSAPGQSSRLAAIVDAAVAAAFPAG